MLGIEDRAHDPSIWGITLTLFIPTPDAQSPACDLSQCPDPQARSQAPEAHDATHTGAGHSTLPRRLAQLVLKCRKVLKM
jgi:hypothetical protein